MKKLDKPVGYKTELALGVTGTMVHRGGKKHPFQVRLQWNDPRKPGKDKRSYEHCYNWPEAKRQAAKIAKDLDQDSQIEVGANPEFRVAWADYLKWWKERVALKEADQDSYDTIFSGGKCHLLPEFGRKRVRDITSLDIEKWFKKMGTEKGLSPRTRNGLFKRLSPFFKFCRRRNWVALNPLSVDPVQAAPVTKRMIIPTWEDVDLQGEMLRGPRPSVSSFGMCPAGKVIVQPFTWAKLRVIFALGAYGGLRTEEIAALRWERINLNRGFLIIDEREGAMGTKKRIKRPKTPAREGSVVPMSQYLYEELSWWGDYLTGTGRPPESGFVLFPLEKDGGRVPMDKASISRLHSKGLELIGIVGPDGKARYPQYSLRHFYISALAMMGVPMEVIAKRVGHANGAFTSKMYAHVLKTDEEGLIDEIPNEEMWRDRYRRARPAPPLVQIDDATGQVIDVKPDQVTLIGQRLESMGAASGKVLFNLNGWRPGRRGNRGRWETMPEWLHEAVALIGAGWGPREVAKRVKKAPNTLSRAFQQAGLPSPQRCAIRVREARFRELFDMDYEDQDIARVMKVHRWTVLAWRQAHGLVEPAKPLKKKEHSVSLNKGDATELRQNQLKLL